jgi:Flp pilus assembly protein TadG
MFLKILLIVIILLSLLFLSFSFKLVFHKKHHISETTDTMSSALADFKNEKHDVMPERKLDTE